MDTTIDIISTHMREIIPYYIIFEIFYYGSKNILIDFNHIYFLMHFIVNVINTILLFPLITELLYDPTGQYVITSDWKQLNIIYPMIIGLHMCHIIHNGNKIYYDEIIHHIVTHIFWYIIYLADNPIYIAPIISMSGIPGGITYLMLFIQKYDIISRETEKKYSMYLNIWMRAPLCIMFAPILYIQSFNNGLYYETLFMILFIMINGIHFMHNITESYYSVKNSI